LSDKNNLRKYNDFLKEQILKRKIEEERRKLDELNLALELKNQFNKKVENVNQTIN